MNAHCLPKSVRKRMKRLQTWKLTYCARQPSTHALWMVAMVFTLVVYLLPMTPGMSATFSRGLLLAHNVGQPESAVHQDDDRQASFKSHTHPSIKRHERQLQSSTRSPPKACLAMIMKNEGPILPRLFESIRGFVSEYCVVDTGSTDNTIEVLKSIDMPGVLVEEPFVNFAVTRNFLLDTCRAKTDCDYLVLLDADMVLKVSPEWDWTKLDGQDVYDFVQVSSIEYNNVRMVRRTADKVKVVGATHEYYDVPSEYTHRILPKRLVYIDDVGDGKAKGDKFERDERLLRAELEREPDNVRTVFYLANTLKDQGKYREAIPFYERRATMGGWYAEADYSLYMLSTCYLALDDLDNARNYAEQAAFRGWYRRAEPLYFLALYLHRHEKYELAWYYVTLAAAIPKPDVSTALFIDFAIYDYWLDYEGASLCRHVFPSGSLHCLQLAYDFLKNHHAPQHLREYVVQDLHWHAQRLTTKRAYTVPLDRDERKHGTQIDGGPMPVPLLLEVHAPAAGDVTADRRERSSLAGIGFQRDNGGVQSNLWVDGSVLKSTGPVKVRLLNGGTSVSPKEGGGTAAVLLGRSVNGSKLFRAPWPAQAGTDASLNMRAQTMTSYDIDLPPDAYLRDTPGPWPFFQVPGLDNATYCITQWYPTIEVATVDFDEVSSTVRFEHVRSISGDISRISPFYGRAVGPGVQWRAAIWFLVEWAPTADAVKMFSAVILNGHTFELQAFTYPFTLEGHPGRGIELTGTHQACEVYEAFDIVERDGEEMMMVGCTRKDDRGGIEAIVRAFPLSHVWKLIP